MFSDLFCLPSHDRSDAPSETAPVEKVFIGPLLRRILGVPNEADCALCKHSNRVVWPIVLDPSAPNGIKHVAVEVIKPGERGVRIIDLCSSHRNGFYTKISFSSDRVATFLNPSDAPHAGKPIGFSIKFSLSDQNGKVQQVADPALAEQEYPICSEINPKRDCRHFKPGLKKMLNAFLGK